MQTNNTTLICWWTDKYIDKYFVDVIESEDNPPHYHIDNDHIEYHTRSEDGISDYPFLTHIDQGLGDNIDLVGIVENDGFKCNETTNNQI